MVAGLLTALQTNLPTGGTTLTSQDWIKLGTAAAFVLFGYFTNKQGSIQVTTTGAHTI